MIELSYDKLWHKLADEGITKRTQLVKEGLLNYQTLKAMNNNQPVHLKVILRLCEYFHCNVDDIITFK